MKYALWIFGALAGLLVMFGILQFSASERVEVVQLHTVDRQGAEQITRLWIVDHEGLQYLRGEVNAGWFQRLQEQDDVKLTRRGKTARYTHRPRPDKLTLVNRLMKEKYTWGDDLVETLLGGRAQSRVIELHPASPAG